MLMVGVKLGDVTQVHVVTWCLVALGLLERHVEAIDWKKSGSCMA
jgi:hypothetical protein